MLRRLPYELINYASFLIFAVIVVSLQTSLWLQVFGFLPPPYLWIPILCYWAITRHWVRGLIMSYLLSLVLQTFTSISLEMIFFSVISLYVIMYLLRDRLLWRGHVYFSFSCFIATLLHPILVFVFSHIVDIQPVREFHFFGWILSSLLTALAAFPFYTFLLWLDRITFGQGSDVTEAEFS